MQNQSVRRFMDRENLPVLMDLTAERAPEDQCLWLEEF